MKRNKWWTYGIFIALTLLVGMLSGFLSREGMEQVSKLPQSALTPPSWVFPVVWGILFGGIAYFLVGELTCKNGLDKDVLEKCF